VRIRTTRSRRVWVTLASATTLFVAGISIAAQPPPPPAPARAPQPFLGPSAIDPSWGDFSPKEPIKALTPEESARHFVLPPGYRMELVLSEPQIEAPTALTFDANGRMFVVEMKSYMRDADATGEYEPISRISMHESTKGDGVYDRHTVFLDKLVLPRMASPLDDSILTMETDTNDIYRHWDTDRDGVADKKELFFTGAGRKGNLEHQTSGFVWALDNWIYSTLNAFRIRWTPQGVRTSPTAPNGGQWGLTQDDDGKVWFVDAGGERGPVNFQTPIQYGAFNVRDQFEEDFDTVWPINRGLSDMEGGRYRVRMPVGVLNHFTATCGQDVFRGDRLPDDLRGDLLFAEPVGRLIRRAKVVVTEGLTQLQNAYPRSEFILSTDPLFRPVNMATAPDGTLYIVDMYQGIVQESEWTRRGSYLRRKIEQYQMDKVIGHGRIWRLVYEGTKPSTETPRMLDEPAAALVRHLEHANGWWRDTAQRQLVLRQDKSVAPALREMTRRSPSLLGRIHALWTLEGLEALDAGLLREMFKDANPPVRVQAIRASETLYKAGDTSLLADVRELSKDKDTQVVIQALLTLNVLKAPDIKEVVRAAQAVNRTRGVREIGDQIVEPPMNTFFGGGGFRATTLEQRTALQTGAGIYAELCYACHGADGKGAPMAGAPAGTKLAPPLAGSPRVQGHRDHVIKALLHGMSGAIDGNTYPGIMAPMGANTDEWVASVASYIRNTWGNSGAFITAADVATVRASAANRTEFWTAEEIERTLPVLLPAHATWKATASHNAPLAPRAFALNGPAPWSSGGPQQAGMWFQVELPEAASLTEIQFESPGGFRAAPRPARTPASTTSAPGVPAAPEAPTFPAIVPAFPREYKVEVSLDGSAWAAVAEGKGAALTTVITFPQVRARFVRLTQTGAIQGAPVWTIQRLRLYQPPGTVASGSK
jgi:mono/diheme cytochrome c family protein/glucose/arabinose dehydrogenase